MSKAHRYHSLLHFPVILLVLLLASHSMQAQVVADTLVAIQDTVLPDLTDPPAGEEDSSYDEETTASENTGPFLPKFSQLSGGGPDSLQTRSIAAAQLKKLQDDKAFWYANYIFQKKKEAASRKKSASFTDSALFETILWMVIIGVFIAVLFMYLSNSNVRLFRKNRSIRSAEEEDVVTENIFAINYRREIDKAVNAGNYRLAVRLQFLQLLRTLSDRQLIDYKQDRTNFDYLLQLNKSSWYPDFFRLTRSYEYSWYGQFEIDQQKYNLIKNDFESFDRKLR